jgi:hypothetical protein
MRLNIAADCPTPTSQEHASDPMLAPDAPQNSQGKAVLDAFSQGRLHCRLLGIAHRLDTKRQPYTRLVRVDCIAVKCEKHSS